MLILDVASPSCDHCGDTRLWKHRRALRNWYVVEEGLLVLCMRMLLGTLWVVEGMYPDASQKEGKRE
jgi:hypothetical protein